MKIVNREEFLKLGTVVFAKYEGGGCFGNVGIKYEDNCKIDFVYSDLFGDINCLDSGEYMDAIEQLENGESIEMSVEETTRDGLFNKEEKYLIFEKKDVEKVINILGVLL